MASTTSGRGHSNGGRRTRGPRKFIGIRAPIGLAEKIGQAADEAGLSLSDYVALCMAKVHDYELPPLPRVTPSTGEVQQELPISA